MPLDLPQLISTIGHLGVFAMVFAESGLLVGFFLPGDSLLFTAGLLAGHGLLSLPVLLLGSFIAAALGDSVGYALGSRIGPKIFTRENSLLFHKEHLERTRRFFTAYGSPAVVLARFIPIVRTFTPVLAGVGLMPYTTFLTYNLIGAALWALGVPLLGYFLGQVIPNADRYLLPIVAVIIVASFLPPLWHLYRERRRSVQRNLHEIKKTV